jgi:hypothetical protein
MILRHTVPSSTRARRQAARLVRAVPRTGLAALIAAVLAHPASAQVANAQPGTGQPAARATQPSVDVTRLPIDLDRIQRGLAQNSRERVERDGLNLRYVIDVFGQAPRIELFTKADNLQTGPVPYGAPTHREMIYMITPQEFRAPVMDFSGLLRWLSDKAKEK